MVDANLARRSVQHSRAACRSIIWEIWALSVDDREVDSVVVDEGETDELASEVRIGLTAGGRWIRTSGSWSRDRQTVMGEVTAFSKPGRIGWGTGGSNPSPSSGESLQT